MTEKLPNGATEIKPSDISTHVLVEVLVEGVKQLSEKIESLEETILELKESVANISTPAVDLGAYDDYE